MKLAVCILIFFMTQASFAKEVYLDVRTAEEFSQGHIPDALNIDFLKPEFEVEVSKLDRNDTYKVYCRMGSRATKAVMLMQTLGFKNLKNLGSFKNAQNYYQKEQNGEPVK